MGMYGVGACVLGWGLRPAWELKGNKGDTSIAERRPSHGGQRQPLGPEWIHLPWQELSYPLASHLKFSSIPVESNQAAREWGSWKRAEVNHTFVPQLRPHMGTVGSEWMNEWLNTDRNVDYNGIETLSFWLQETKEPLKSSSEVHDIWLSFHPGPGEDFCIPASPSLHLHFD